MQNIDIFVEMLYNPLMESDNMNRTTKKKKQKPFQTLYTVVITLFFVAIVFVFGYAWNTLGFGTHTVSYQTQDTDVTGALPERRRFEKGDEVVVRAGVISRKDYSFAGWKDINGVIENSGEILKNGTVFIMPDKDVLFEAVWEEESITGAQNDVDTNSDTSSKTNDKIYLKKSGKDYINVRKDPDHDSDVVTKVSDSKTEIHYTGKSESVFSEDDNKSYTWYYVSIPSLDEEGWIRSDMLSKASGNSSKEDNADDDKTEGKSTKTETYLKSMKYDAISLYKEADSSSGLVARIDDDEASLYFNGKTEETKDTDGNTITWYFVETDQGEGGWVQKSRIEHLSEE